MPQQQPARHPSVPDLPPPAYAAIDPRLAWWLAFAAVLAATWLVYLPGLTGGWLLDDYGNIVNNGGLAMSSLSWQALWHAMWSFDAGPLGRPLSLASFALERYFFGLDPYVFKTTNLAIHLLNTALFIGFTRALLRAWRRRHAPAVSLRRIDWIALGIGALWALHPVNLTSILYAVQRETALAATFTLAGLWAYVAIRKRLALTPRTLVLLGATVGLFGLLGTYVKETGALLPVFTLLLELTVLRFADPDGRRRPLLIALYAFILIAPAVAGLLWLLPGITAHGYLGREFGLGERLLTEGRVVVFYLGLILGPRLSAMTLYHDDFAISTGLLSPPTTLLSFLLIATLFALALWQIRRRPLFALGILWFFVAQVLTSTIFPLEIAFEHRLYLAAWGIILTLMSLVFLEPLRIPLRLPRRHPQHLPRLGVIFVVMLTLALGLTTAARAMHWSSNLMLARWTAKNHPDSPRGTYLLSRIYTNLALDGKTRFIAPAFAASEKAARVYGAGLDPWVAMVLLAAQTGRRIDPAWFKGMIRTVAERPFTVSDVNAIEALVSCITRHQCRVPRTHMLRLFTAVYHSPHIRQLGMNYANVLVTEANYIGYASATQRARSAPLLKKAANLMSTTPQYQINVFNIALRDDKPVLARKMLQRVERLNRLGRLDLTVAHMRRRLATHTRAPASSGPH